MIAADMLSYEAFQARARARAQFDGRRGQQCSPFRQQQKLLRVHLRHFLLTAGRWTASVEDHNFADGSAGGADIGMAWMHEIKRSAALQEALRRRGAQSPSEQDAASRGQRAPRKSHQTLRRRRENAWCETPEPQPQRARSDKMHTHGDPLLVDASGDVELSSTSVFVPLQQDVIHPGTQWEVVRQADTATAQLAFDVTPRRQQPSLSQHSALVADPQILYPYELTIDLHSARDLTPSATQSMTARGYIGAELELMHARTRMAQWTAPPASYIAATDEMVRWKNAALRFGIDPASDDKKMCHDPQVVVNEWSIRIVVNHSSSKRPGEADRDAGRVLGKLEIPLILLETPLAQEYSMCRWFPLEKATPGVPTRGDIRVSISYSMCQPLSNGETRAMVPYKPNVDGSTSGGGSSAAEDATKKNAPDSKLQRKKKPAPRSETISKQSIPAKPGATISSRRTSFIQEQAEKHPPSAKDGRLRSSSGGSTATRLKACHRNASSSPRRCSAKAEVLSPPSSPSSFSSENNEQRGMFSPSRPKRNSSISTDTKQQDTDHAPNEPQSASGSPPTPAQPFLKRKPYKVVFRKLDWSSVSSRTDSSWNHSSSPLGPKSSLPEPQSDSGSKTAPKSPRAGKTTTASTNVSKKGKSGAKPHNGEEPPRRSSRAEPVLDPATTDRLQALSRAIYDCCQVTQETVSLAQLKYQSERTKYLLAHSHAKPSLSPAEEPSGSRGASQQKGVAGSSSYFASKAALSTLWKELLTDAAGNFYAAKLEKLLSGEQS